MKRARVRLLVFGFFFAGLDNQETSQSALERTASDQSTAVVCTSNAKLFRKRRTIIDGVASIDDCSL